MTIIMMMIIKMRKMGFQFIKVERDNGREEEMVVVFFSDVTVFYFK
jgi:hypothetical protein